MKKTVLFGKTILQFHHREVSNCGITWNKHARDFLILQRLSGMDLNLKTIYVYGYGDWPHFSANDVLITCRNDDVECFCFRLGGNPDDPTPNTPCTVEAPYCPTRLKAVVIEYYDDFLPSDFVDFLTSTRIRSVTFLFPYENPTRERKRAITALKHMVKEKWLQNNYSVREIVFKTPDGRELSGYLPYAYVLATQLERNRACFKKCQTACTILLSKRIAREKQISFEVCKIIASMIWETRGTKLWCPLE